MIWYSHINEDSSVERAQLAHTSYDHVACVAGSGERFIALLDHPAKEFHAIDINPEAILLLELKLAALKTLEVELYLFFIGHTNCGHGQRWELYRSIREHLGSAGRLYWDSRKHEIEKGILHCGHHEKYLGRIRPSLKFLLGDRFTEVFKAGGKNYPGFPTYRWALLTRIYQIRFLYRLSGNLDQAFISPDADIKRVTAGLGMILERNQVNSSYLFYLIFQGDLSGMPPSSMPVSLRPAFLQTVKEKLMSGLQVHFIVSDYRSALREMRLLGTRRVFHSLSDIIGYQATRYTEELIRDLSGRKEQLIMLRSFLVNNIDDAFLLRAGLRKEQWTERSEEELTCMYQVFEIRSN